MSKSIFISCLDSQWNAKTGQTVEILHQLTPDKVDDEVGPMFRIRFPDGVETDAFLDELPDLEKYRLGEVIFDITTCLPLFTGRGTPAENYEYDSRELYACIYEWAKEFEEKNPNPGFDYFVLIEEFACAKLREYFELEG